MDIPAVATAALALLSPYLAKAGESIAKKVGEGVYEKVQRLFKAIKKQFKGDQTAEDALERVEQEPEAQTWQDVLQGILIMKMERDPAFASEVQQLVEESQHLLEGDTISQSINISGQAGDVFQIGKMSGDITKGD